MGNFQRVGICSIVQQLFPNVTGLQIICCIQRVNDPKLISGTAHSNIVAFPGGIIHAIILKMERPRIVNVFTVNQA